MNALRYMPSRPSGALNNLAQSDGYIAIDFVPAWSAVYLDGRARAVTWEALPYSTTYRARLVASVGQHDLTIVPPGGKARAARVKVGGPYAPALLRFDQMAAVGSGAVGDDVGLVTIPQNEHIVDPRVREVQRQLLGVGITVGPQGADGRFSVNTANGLQAFARWYNGLPEGPMLDPRDLKRGPVIAVDRLLTPEKQVALRRFAARASDVLTSINYSATVTPPTPIPWGTVALVGTAGAALLGLVVYAVRESSKTPKKAQHA